MLNAKDFEYYAESKLPKLVLAIECSNIYSHSDMRKYNFKQDRKWKLVVHQTAGMGCHQRYLYATELTPRTSTTRKKIKELCSFWLDSDIGVFGKTLTEVNSYNDQLDKMLGVSCESSYMDFEEGIYPIDCTKDNLFKMTKTVLPDALDSFIEWDNEMDKFVGCMGRWKLFILGENGD